MDKFKELKITGYDHIEFAVSDLEKSSELYLRMGFEKVATREILERKLKSYLLIQNDIRILLSQSNEPKDDVSKFVSKHGDGVITVAFQCVDALSTFEKTIHRGAHSAEAPKSIQKDYGKVNFASIKAFGDVKHTFVTREGNLFLEGFDVYGKPVGHGYGLTQIDHVTNNVEKSQMDTWVKYYQDIFGLENTRFFDIHTKRTGLYSKVMESSDGIVKMPVNEPTEDASQIQEFIDTNHGPGVQHIALATNNILPSMQSLRKQGIQFLDRPPHTYYEMIPGRVPNVTENLDEIEQNDILIDGDQSGYLLQIFTQNLVGPFFYEIIQRKGHKGFGEGNFGALFEAIERDQIRRGVLKE
jgi:4-hydroxyphenylpyruvate dioxygenase